MLESEQIADLATALAKAQAAMGPAIINRVNPHFKNRYADLAAVFDAIRKPLTDNGLSVTQTTYLRDGMFVLRTTLRHSTGQWVASEYPLPLGAKPQELGSALTYGRRYELSAIVGVASDEDDDGVAMRRIGNGKQPVEDSGELVSKDQLDALIDAINSTDTDVAAFLRRYNKRFNRKAEMVADILASHYDACIKAIGGAQ